MDNAHTVGVRIGEVSSGRHGQPCFADTGSTHKRQQTDTVAQVTPANGVKVSVSTHQSCRLRRQFAWPIQIDQASAGRLHKLNALRVRQPKRRGQAADRSGIGRAPRATLQIGDPALAEGGAFGEFFL
jgi:hypothetical protein